MSRRARTRPDKRAQAFALAHDDAPLVLTNGDTFEPRTPWQLPGKDHEPEPVPHDPWGYEPPKNPVPIGPTDVRGPRHA